MSEIYELKVEPRERAGKGSARAARREGFVPAVIYGDKKDPVMINIPRNELVRHLNRGGFLNHIFEIKVNGDSHKVLPRDLQTHPLTDTPLHVDFLRLSKGAKVEIEVPVHFLNEEESEGIKRGGVLNIVRHTIECLCPMDAIPEYLEVSLEGMDIGDGVHASSLKLPEGVELVVQDRDFTIATVAAPTIITAAEEEEEAEAAEEELEEGEEAAEGEEGEEAAEGGEEKAAEGEEGEGKKEGGE